MEGKGFDSADPCCMCGAEADVAVQGELYCARCALELTLDRLYLELGVTHDHTLIRHSNMQHQGRSSHLPRLGDEAAGNNDQLFGRFKRTTGETS